jgi:uncharacterized membrane protein
VGSESNSSLAETAIKNVLTIAQIEQELLRKRSLAERVAAIVSRFIGSLSFLAVQLIVCVTWVALNNGLVPAIPVFDPFPYSLLALIISLEAIFLTTFVVMNQYQQIRRDDRWAHLNLQVSLLAEQEITKILQMQDALNQRFGLPHSASDKEIKDLAKTTEVIALAEEIGKTREVIPE